METLRHIEFGLSPAALLLLIAYHAHLGHKTRSDPLRTALGLSRHIRGLWVQTVMSGGKDILAIQTLRNWTMAATFMASTAILIGLGIFNLAVTADQQGELAQVAGQFSNNRPGLWLSKLILLGGDFLFAFFNFTLAVRYFNHTAFMINLPTDASSRLQIADVVAILDRGGTHYTIGMRCYYLAFPLTLWLIGPLWLLAGTLLLIAALFRLDRGL